MIVSYTNEQNEPGNYKSTKNLRKELKSNKLPKKERVSILKMVKNELSLSRKIGRLETMQRFFKYWHVAHMPFALVMLIIVIIHIGVTLTLGYKWIF